MHLSVPATCREAGGGEWVIEKLERRLVHADYREPSAASPCAAWRLNVKGKR